MDNKMIEYYREEAKRNAELREAYREVVRKFLVLNYVKEVVCTDTNEHFFDRILVDENGTLKVYKYGLKETTWDNLYFDFACDYAVCLANMEKDLYMQERRGKHEKFTFTFNDKYMQPILFSAKDVDDMEEEYNNRRNEVA